MQSIFDRRPENSPQWPTLRGAALTELTKLRLQSALRLMYWTEGESNLGIPVEELSVHTWGEGRQVAANLHGMATSQPAWSWEVVRYLTKKDDQRPNKKGPLYFVCWAGQYITKLNKTGIILHISAQFPHLRKYNDLEIEHAACLLYSTIVNNFYGDIPIDKDVSTFLQQIREVYGQ